MTITILGILSALIPFVIWLWKRKDAKLDDPEHQHAAKSAALAKEVITGNERAANQSLDDDLARLRYLQSNRSGQSRPPPPNGK